MPFQAHYFDGLSARARAVLVTIATGTIPAISFDSEGEALTFSLAEIDIQARLGAAKRIIDLPNGGRLEALEISELEKAKPSMANTFWAALHYLENHLGWVLVSLFVTVFVGWMFLQFGIPKLAEQVVMATPPSMEASLGEQVLKGLDSKVGYFSPPKTEKAHQENISTALKNLCEELNGCPNYRLEFRGGGAIGANAFALPGGIMVVTDELVALSKNETEVIAVLAHELGHVQKRHAFRQSIQGVMSGLILAAVTGDVSSMASGLSGVLLQMRYSKAHETEADTFALNALRKACLPPKAFADILQRLEDLDKAPNPTELKKTSPESRQESNSISEMLSSHPDTQSRIKPFIEARLNCGERNYSVRTGAATTELKGAQAQEFISQRF
jgi:Zn-dependent protease with chaperone function